MKIRAGSSFVVVLFLLSSAWAQEPAHSLSELPQRVQKDERVRITLRDGTMINGRFDSVSDSLLRVKGSRNALREIPEPTLKEITKKRPESGWNGVLIGLGVGAAAGLVAVGTTCGNDSECSAIATAVFIPTFAGGGAAVGAIIDRTIEKYDPIYVQSATTNRLRLRLMPTVSKDIKGVQLSMSF